jgi:hypothetical protein
MIAHLYRVEKLARDRELSGEARRILREQGSQPVLSELQAYLLRIRDELLPKSAAGQAVAYALKNWTALTRYCEDGDLEIDINIANAARGIWQIMPIPGLCRVEISLMPIWKDLGFACLRDAA